MPGRRQKVADQIVEVLREADVDRIYGVVGDSLNPVVDAVRRTAGIEWAHVHHEESGAFAAGSEALITGKLAVCAGSSGPGNTHLLQGLYDAHRNGAPVLAIASHIPASQIGTDFFQATHPEIIFRDCSHFCELVTVPEQLPRVLRIAIQHALGRSGVAVIVLPGDLADARAVNPSGRSVLGSARPRIVPCESDIDALAGELDKARKVTLFCGAGVRGAHAEVMGLASKLNSPVGHALGGKEWIQWDNPFDVGMSGLLGYGACHEAMNEADLLILLGTDFPYDNFLPEVRTVQIDHDPTKLGRRTDIALGVQGDVLEVLNGVLPRIKQKADRTFLDRMLRRHAEMLENVVSVYTRGVEQHKPIHPEFVAAQLDELADDDAVFTVDTGMCNVWAARYLTPNGQRRVLGSWRHGSMANALPHAIGAQFADRGRQVISMSGDGGLAMLLGELLTAKLHDLPLKIVLFNNASLAMVKIEMLVDGLPDHGTDHPAHDFTAIAKGAGIHAVKVTEPSDVRGALEETLSRPGPALVEMITDPNALSVTSHVTMDQMAGFALAASKIVLDGGVGRMVDLARSNLRNIPRP